MSPARRKLAPRHVKPRRPSRAPSESARERRRNSEVWLATAAFIAAVIAGVLAIPSAYGELRGRLASSQRLDLVLGNVAINVGVRASDALRLGDIACSEATSPRQRGIEATVPASLTGTGGDAIAMTIGLRRAASTTVARCSHDLTISGPTNGGELVYWFPEPRQPGSYYVSIRAAVKGHPDVLAPGRNSSMFRIPS